MKNLAISLCCATVLTFASMFAYAQVVNPGGGGGSAITNYALETGGNLASLLASLGGNSAAHTCATSFTNNGCLGQIDDDIKGPVPIPAYSNYNTVAAGQTAQALTGGGGGATGDFLSHCVVTPTTTSPGVVTVLDNSTSIVPFAGGASSLSNLVPFTLLVGAKSKSGAWKITTGTGLSVACFGEFT